MVEGRQTVMTSWKVLEGWKNERVLEKEDRRMEETGRMEE